MLGKLLGVVIVSKVFECFPVHAVIEGKLCHLCKLSFLLHMAIGRQDSDY